MVAFLLCPPMVEVEILGCQEEKNVLRPPRMVCPNTSTVSGCMGNKKPIC